MHPRLPLIFSLLCASSAVLAALDSSQWPKTHDTEYWFDQLIDHTNPSAGTFKQRYFFSDQYYKGQGAPIVFTTPGETDASPFYAQLSGPYIHLPMLMNLGAAGVVLEHRYFGKSSPYPDLTAQHLGYLTVDQSIEDLVYFAQNVQLPWNSTQYNSHPDTVPWIHVGCSYPGLLVAYTQEKHPDVFAAAWATSAPVQADGDFWEYWEPIAEGLPQNCTADLTAAVAYIDNLLDTGSPADVQSLKAKFGLESLANDDFGTVLTTPFNGWQDLQASSFKQKGYDDIYQMCDAIETTAQNTTNTATTGVGLPLALENWAAIYKASYPDQACPNTGGSCLSTYNYTTDPSYTNTSNADSLQRGWTWLVCTELGWFQVGDPENNSGIVSKYDSLQSWQRICGHMFPNPDGTPGNYSTGQGVNQLNTEFKGWNIVADNLFVVNGQYDPWRSASLSSRWAPAFMDTPTQEITVIANGHHCWDFYLSNTVVNQDVLNAQQLGLNTVYGWLQEWYKAHPNVPNTLPASAAQVIDFNNTVNALIAVENGTIPDSGTGTSSDNNDANDLQNRINQLLNEKRLAIASFVLNGVLLLALLAAAVALMLNKRRRPAGGDHDVPLLPTKWKQHDDLGEYGGGPRGGGRGIYKALGIGKSS